MELKLWKSMTDNKNSDIQVRLWVTA